MGHHVEQLASLNSVNIDSAASGPIVLDIKTVIKMDEIAIQRNVIDQMTLRTDAFRKDYLMRVIGCKSDSRG